MKLASWLSFIALFGLLTFHPLTSAEIVIGQTAGFTGTAGPSVQEMTLGARLIIDDANARGGIRGQKIKLISMDDEFDVKRAAANAKTLIDEHAPLALFLNRGTAHTEAIAPLLVEAGIPLIAPSTGAMSFQETVVREIFPLRPTYQKEVAAMISQLWSMGLRELVCIHVADAFGRDAMKGVERQLGALKWDRSTVTVVPFDRESEDLTQALQVATRQVNGKYPSVLVIGSNRATARTIQGIREAGSSAYVAALSTVASEGFVKKLGAHAQFVMVAQVFPKGTAFQIPVVRKTTELLKASSSSSKSLTPAMLEGAVAAELLVEALRRCPSPCTSKGLINTLESGRPFDIGWPDHEISYTSKKRAGINFATTSIISGGKFLQ